jgi:uncharacterized protein (TIGR01777 family)
MATVLITGGTGLIGSHIAKRLIEMDQQVIILTRNPKGKKAANGMSYAEWDIEQQLIDENAFSKADHIIHLAGAGVADKKWSASRKKEIKDSRVKSGELLLKCLGTFPNKIKTIVSTSAIGWYGPDPDSSYPSSSFHESAKPDISFLGTTCREWEESIAPARAKTRLVILRVGIVMAKEGGAFREFYKPLRSGIAAVLGNGQQIVSWIHIDDLVDLYLFALDHTDMKGVFNAVAPYPVSNKTLILSMAKARGKFYIPVPVPAFVLKIMMGEMSIEVLKSATVSAEKLLATGFQFRFPTIDEAMKDLA